MKMASIHEQQKPHFVLFPFMAQGHTIPMIDIARLLANRGAIITILFTPKNAIRVKPAIDRAIDSGLNIHVHHLKFPSVEAGLPEGCENLDMVPDFDGALKFFKATAMLQVQLQELLPKLEPFPTCLIADMSFPWTTNVALSLRIPRIVFHGTSCISLLIMHIYEISKEFEAVDSDSEYFVVPGLPDKIEMTKAQLWGTITQLDSDWATFRDQVREGEVQAFGTVVNTFEEVEPEYVKEYGIVRGKKVWCIGPVSLCNKDEIEQAERGNKAAIDKHDCLRWLESREPSSVIYVCLGSLSRLATSQLIELGLGLEASNRPFIWVIRDASDELKKWLLDEKFEDRVKDRGLLINGWAPQVLILSHSSVGGFLTHCGWNSTLEGVTAGLPMVTWPVLGEQFCNEKLIVNVIKTGIRAGIEVPIFFGQEEKVGVLVKSDEIKMVIDMLMDGGEEGGERRERARKLGETAKKAMEEGGSSYLNLTLLIEDVIKYEANSIES